jgi:hypothetical protein
MIHWEDEKWGLYAAWIMAAVFFLVLAFVLTH